MIAVVSHDAGGAELVSSWVAAHEEEFLLVLAGPAKAIFEAKFGRIEITSLRDSIVRSDWVLCGSSWDSNLELSAIRMSKMMGKKCVLLFDHWANFRERLCTLDGAFYSPDELWVVDRYAEEIANRESFNVPIQRVRNYFFENIERQIDSYPQRPESPDKLSVLFVTEPIQEHENRKLYGQEIWGYSEREGLEYFVENVVKVLPGKTIDLTVRLHPSESIEKYSWLRDVRHFGIRISRGETLIQEILKSNTIVGLVDTFTQFAQ